MVKRTGSTDVNKRKLVKELRKEKRKAWKYASEILDRPARKQRAVNVNKIDRFSQEGDIVVVPGKVLGTGHIGKRVTVIAFDFSSSAIKKIKDAGGEVMSFSNGVNTVKDFSKVKVII